jgi:hypothetical protein
MDDQETGFCLLFHTLSPSSFSCFAIGVEQKQAWMSSKFFLPEKARSQKFSQVKRHQRLTMPWPRLKNVLTAKKGLYLGVLAGKQGTGREKKSFYFALFHVLVVFCGCKFLSVRTFRKIFASKIIRAEKPTVGFLFLAGSGNMAA